jgi:hypothetical protein
MIGKNCGKHRSKEQRKRQSELAIERYKNPEERKKISKALNRPEVEAKRREGIMNYYADLKNREKQSRILKKVYSNPIMREKCKKSQNRPEVREKKSIAATKNWQDIDIRNRTIEALIITHNLSETKEKHHKVALKLWQNPEFQKMQAIAKNIKPNKPERTFDKLTPDIVKYTGDWRFFIITNKKTRNPDFKVSGQKKIIELFGDYYHEGENPNDIIEEYKNVGWECIVFWEHEVYKESEKVLKETLKFINEE